MTIAAADTDLDVLRFARARREDADTAEADVLFAALTWAHHHPAESITDAALATPGGNCPLPLAGEGAPLVAEFAIPEFASALGLSTDAGRRLIADALELGHRLPRTWARSQDPAHRLPAWRARRIAQGTAHLTAEVAAWVDQQVAPFAHKLRLPALERLLNEAVARFMPDQAREDAAREAEVRFLRIDHHQVSFAGTSRLDGELDLADALDLDLAISTIATQLAELGSTDSLDARRAQAAGLLARGELALDLDRQGSREDANGSTPRGRKPRDVVLYVHLAEAALGGSLACEDLGLARVESQQRTVLTEQVRAWCGNATVTVKPVIDLNRRTAVTQYEVPDRLAELVALRDHTCVFPWCTRPARACDTDHVVAFADGGATGTDNLAPLCRRHHRLKTHGPWGYTPLRARHLSLDQPARLPVPARPHRHPRRHSRIDPRTRPPPLPPPLPHRLTAPWTTAHATSKPAADAESTAQEFDLATASAAA